MQEDQPNEDSGLSLDQYLADVENLSEIESCLADISNGRFTMIDPDNVWDSIR